MDMMRGEQIAQADLADWRKLAQGLHARYRVREFSTGASFVVAVGQTGDELGHHPIVSIGPGYVDLRLVSDDAIYRDDEGTEHVVQWVTKQDVDEGKEPQQRFHVEVYVAPEVVERRVAAAIAAGGTVVDYTDAPGLTVIADQDGNPGVVCADMSAVRRI